MIHIGSFGVQRHFQSKYFEQLHQDSERWIGLSKFDFVERIDSYAGKFGQILQSNAQRPASFSNVCSDITQIHNTM